MTTLFYRSNFAYPPIAHAHHGIAHAVIKIARTLIKIAHAHHGIARAVIKIAHAAIKVARTHNKIAPTHHALKQKKPIRDLY